jgi:hypothetical protein
MTSIAATKRRNAAGPSSTTSSISEAGASDLPFSACQIRAGENGICGGALPVGRKASVIALISAAGAPVVAASPTPFAPSGFIGLGVSVCDSVSGGRSSARGMA